ncbi:hypothetical protein AB0F30_17225 [Streptomyces sp. NPDC029006]|uniref:hypothetical protein n=1 Tax=Streptomyces sp. NPDC029006 TaxID=3155467 RepID=UPI0033D326B0
MAVSYFTPITDDEIRSIPEAVELLAESDHPLARSTLVRLCRDRGVKLVKHGRTNYAPWTEILEAHRDWVNAGHGSR